MSIMGKWKVVKDMVMGQRLGAVVINMWESGRMVKDMVTGHQLMPMVQSITAANG